MTYAPKERRPVIAHFQALCRDEKKSVAAEMTAEHFGVCVATVRRWIREDKKEQIETLTSSDFEITTPVPRVPKSTEVSVEEKRILELVASDIHFPYEDAPAYQLLLDVAKDLQPDIFVLLGDILDCYAVSAHDKDANRGTPAAFKEELIYAKAKLTEIRELLPNARIIFKEGNHETRLSRYIVKNAPALSNIGAITLPELLDLNSLNIEWIGNDERLQIGRLHHIHGNEIGGSGQSPARLKYNRMLCNVIFGHLHTRDKHRARAYDGQQHGAWANPCLCNLKAEYVHHAANWSLGFTLIDHDTDRSFQVEEIEVIKPHDDARTGKCNVRGKIYTVEV